MDISLLTLAVIYGSSQSISWAKPLNIQDRVSLRSTQSEKMELGWGLKIGRSAAEYHLVFWVLRGAPQQLPSFTPVCQELSISPALAPL